MAEENVTVIVDTPPPAADSVAQLQLSEILLSLQNLKDEWGTRLTTLEERLANQPPATVVEVVQTVETPTAEPEPEPEPEAEALSIGGPEATLTEAEAATLESASGGDHESSATTVENETPPEPIAVAATRQRTSLANLLLGKRRA